MMRDARVPLRGSIVPLVTPFADGAIDLEAFEASIERQVAAGSDGIVVTGTTGEPTSVTADERVELFRVAVATAAGRIPVLAATGTPNQVETLRLTRDAEALGVDAVLVVCPAFVKPSQPALVQHFVTVAASTDLPTLIYNIPGRAAVGVTPQTVQAIVEEAPNVVGLKHASNDLDLVTDLLLRLGDDFALFCGLESYSYPFLAVGGAGLMSAVGNLYPEQIAKLCALVRDQQHPAALKLHRELFRLNEAVFWDTNPVPLKAMLELRGIGNGEVRPPLLPASTDLRSRLSALLGQPAAA
jgi:4-hydroxy-tetrahydrodipicolinate synthase